MMRVLVAITPRMYRQAVAFSIRRRRPGCEVRVAAPEDTEGELATFRPHLLVHNDTDRFSAEVVAGVLYRITVLYSDGMNARISADGETSEAHDISTEDLLLVVDRASASVGEE